MKEKIVIYQLLPRLFSNSCPRSVFDGSIVENGCGKFNDLSTKVLSSLKDFGITHIWLTGIIRHATLTDYPQYGLPAGHPDIVKGKAGSPYAISDYYDVDPDLANDVPARMKEFEMLVERIHSLGLKVIIDFVPNHVSRDYWSRRLPQGHENLGATDNRNLTFSPSNNFYYFPGEALRIQGLDHEANGRYQEMPAKATGNDVFRPDPDTGDWYETVKLNYGIDYRDGRSYFHPLPDTWIRMAHILLFWSGKGVDGFRCDMAGMVPVDFWHYSISLVKNEFPHLIFIAELYEPHRYRDYLETGYFDYLYDKVGLYDALRGVITGKLTTRSISTVWQSLEGMDDRMMRFLENHDEQRIASPHFAGDPWKALPAMAIAALMNQGPLLVYSGQEVGEPATGARGFSGDDGRTSIFDYTTLPELQKWFRQGQCDGLELSENQRLLRIAYALLLQISRQHPVFSNGYLYDLMWFNEAIPNRDRIFAFLRYGGIEDEEAVLVVAAFDPSIKKVTIRIPEHAIESMGFGDRTSICLRPFDQSQESHTTLIISQLTSIGAEIAIENPGYSVYRVF